MCCIRWIAVVLAFIGVPAALQADAFDNYINPILAKAPGAEGVKEVKELTPSMIVDQGRVLPGTTAAFLIVQTNEGRFSKLLVQTARVKVTEKKIQVPILQIERFVTYREGQERAVQASGNNVHLYDGFHFSLDIGQVVPEKLAGDLRFVAAKEGDTRGPVLEPVGKAKMYLLTKPLPEATPKKPARLVVGESFETRYYNGTYKLYDDGRRSGSLTLSVNDDDEVTGSFYSDKDGQKYQVTGKIGSPKHNIQFTIKFPQTDQTFQGMLFTGNGKAITGSSRLQDRDAGFYALRVEEE